MKAKGSCSRADCAVKEDMPCEMGHVDFLQCPHFTEAKDQAPLPDPLLAPDDSSGQRLPWTGRALGLNDMLLASSRSSTTLVGLIGPFNAGKTAFLTSLFVHFAKTGVVGAHSFAGSFTLQAWARLKHPTVWPKTNGPSFPPHTPDTGERVPSLLHLAFREGADQIRDILFTDAPGEWFTRWLQNQSADGAQGARWIADNATQFLFIVDREALAGPQVGKARQDILSLARVLSENRRDRPVIVIWTKSDLTTAPDVEALVREKLLKFFGEHPSFELSVEAPGCLKVLELFLKQPMELGYVRKTSAPAGSAFLAYGATS